MKIEITIRDDDDMEFANKLLDIAMAAITDYSSGKTEVWRKAADALIDLEPQLASEEVKERILQEAATWHAKADKMTATRHALNMALQLFRGHVSVAAIQQEKEPTP